MKKILAMVCVMVAASLTKADLIADWDFDKAMLANGTVPFNGTKADYGVADSGMNIMESDASGVHANSSTSWSFVEGNPSTGSAFSGKKWAVNDYFQFSVSIAGYSQINVAFDQESSPTGPANFIFEYSINGGAFTSSGLTAGGDYNITSTSFTSANHFTEDLTSMTEANDSTVVFRLIDNSTASEGNGTVASTGSSSIDNFIVNGIAAVPEPAAWGAISGLGLIGICGLRTWRQRRSGNHTAAA